MSFVTSYYGLFSKSARGTTPSIERVEIPLLQRDYAQGREDANTARIRGDFLEVLHRALTGGEPVGLDFVYGDVTNGTLTPLDGQQRLTTLFLLHWYLAARAGCLDAEQGWTRFTYETRPSARQFCQRLVRHVPPFPVQRLSAWMRDQAWFMGVWRHDPSIRAMLVMLDAIHERFGGADARAAWDRLVDRDAPAVNFHVLGLEKMGLTEDLYVKMNSRGKPLTDFEHFKALFEEMVEHVHPERAKELGHKVDGAWSDLLWPFRGGNDLIDEEFLCYFDFVTELCAWREGRAPSGPRTARVEAVYGPSNPRARDNLDFLFAALDCWNGEDVPGYFGGLFTIDRHEPGKLAIFGRDGQVNLFAGCCHHYDVSTQGPRTFTLQRTLLLYAVLLHRVEGTPDLPQRLRVVRNLVEASQFEVRAEAMPELIASVRNIVVDGDLRDVPGFNQRQVEEERRKSGFLKEYPELRATLCELEDHPLLRGCLGAFHLDPELIARRARVFGTVFVDAHLPALTGALLACGDYSQRFANRRFFQLGSGKPAAWRELFIGASEAALARTRDVLGVLLDQVGEADGPLAERLAVVRSAGLASLEASETYDWRYYLVKYPAMREGASGIYAGRDGNLGYSLCMLHRKQMNSYYRDPYLLAVLRQSGVGSAVEDPWFMGYEWEERWMTLVRSGVALRCVAAGFAIRPPRLEAHAPAFERVCAAHGVGEDHVLAVPQADRDGQRIDVRDRVELGAALLRALVAAEC